MPFTRERAHTELARCRRGVSQAREALALALAIWDRLPPELDADELDRILGCLEECEAALRRAALRPVASS